ncbi:MAG: hypothetical protein K0U93_10100 [Gammaproteobacteria bacterium]|nr:hypothetical protein [Gammaproteobacteria bacterium]
MPQLDQIHIEKMAEQMLIDFDDRNPGTVFADGLRLELEDAWRVQRAVEQRRGARGEEVIGYKIGCVSGVNQKVMGLTHPVWGALWSTEQHRDGVELQKSNFANVAIEAEFAITVGRAIDPTNAGVSAVLEAVDAVFPVLELHNLMMRGDPPHGHELIANNAIHAGVVRGRPITDAMGERETDLALVFDGSTVDAWSGIRWPHDVLSAVEWLVRRLDEGGRRLNIGDTILVGALGPPIPVGGGKRVDVTSSAFGDVFATFV